VAEPDSMALRAVGDDPLSSSHGSSLFAGMSGLVGRYPFVFTGAAEAWVEGAAITISGAPER